jgi:nascent polypeptide-associated complex subunit alpha
MDTTQKTTTTKEDIIVTNEKKETTQPTQSSQPAQEHVHGENCGHEHGADDKQNKGERKVRKAITKLGMVQIPGVNRVTVRQKDAYIFVVKDPEVFKGADGGNTFIIFGELTFEEPDKNISKENLTKLQQTAGEEVKKEATAQKEEQKVEVVEDTNEVVSEVGIDPEHITMLTDQFKDVPRNKILKVLKKNNNDIVQSILDLQA